MTLTPCLDLSAARWITSSDRPWSQLVEFGPSGFAAYARLRFIPDPVFEGQSENDAPIADDAPLESVQLRAVLETLARHTRTPDDCYFCLWDGWGLGSDRNDSGWASLAQPGPARPGLQLSPADPPASLPAAKVVVPHRAYFLFRGNLSDFGAWGIAESWPGQALAAMPDPAFVWPADHAWCVADDVDPHWAGIGADRSAIDELVADPRIDVVPADPLEDPPRYR